MACVLLQLYYCWQPQRLLVVRRLLRPRLIHRRRPQALRVIRPVRKRRTAACPRPLNNKQTMKNSKLSLSLVMLGVLFVSVSAFAGGPPPAAPDASSSAMLLSLGFAGLAAARKLIR